MDCFLICQWNCRSAISNKGNLEQLLHQENITIALLSETWFKPNSIVHFRGYNITRTDRADGKSGVAVLIRANLKYTEINNLPSPPHTLTSAISIKVNNSLTLTIVSIYILPKSKISLREWSEFLSSIPKPFIIGGDFNSHHICWGCTYTDCYGVTLLDAINEHNLVYLNDGSPTLVKSFNSHSDSAIDLTLCTPDLSNSLHWKVHDDPCGSNHIPIIITADFGLHYTSNSSHKKWKIQKARWSEYHRKASEIFSTSSQGSYSVFVQNIEQVASGSIPKLSNRKEFNGPNNQRKHMPKTWWNIECQAAVDLRKSHYRAYCENPNLENLNKYKNQDALAKKIIKKSKRESWGKYCSSLNSSSPISEVWRKLNSYKNRTKHSYNIISSQSKWVPEFHQKLAPDSCNMQPIFRNPLNSQINGDDLLEPFSTREFDKALKTKSNSAPGLDNIHYSMLSNLPDEAKSTLVNIYNSIWCAWGEIPDRWYDYLILPIKKPGKPDDVSSSYRPIALSSCVLKTFERLIKNRLEFWLEKQKKISSSQFGFRRGKSIRENVAHLVTDIYLSFSRNKSVSAAFLDIQGAYDNVKLDILADKMSILGLPVTFIQNILRLYTNRKLYIKTSDSVLGPRTTSVGLPQGSILSPILYLVYTADIENAVTPGTKILQYADDVVLYTESTQIDQANQVLSASVANINEWYIRNGLTISEDKSMVCTFTRKRFNPPNTVNMGPFNIPYRTTIRYLGISLDSKLNWKSHINNVLKKSENALNILRAFCNHKWGSDPNTIILFYKALIRSVLDFGCIFYGDASKTDLKRIDQISNKCIRTAVGFLVSTPTDVIQAEICEPPLHLRRQYLADKFVIKLQSRNKELISKIHQLFIANLTSPYWKKKKSPVIVESYQYSLEFIDMIHQTSLALPQYEKEYSSLLTQVPTCMLQDFKDLSPDLSNQTFLYEANNRWNSYEYVFTDGSKFTDRVGCAFFHYNESVSNSFQLPPQTSIFTAELTAIKHAMLYCMQHRKSKFVIFTDSKSSVEALKNNNICPKSNYLILDIIDTYNSIIKLNKTVIVVWMRGHAQVTGNTTADHLARKACEDGTVLQGFKVPHTDLTHVIKLKIHDLWQTQFSNSPKGMWYKGIISKLLKKPWFFRENNRTFVRTICRLRSNHSLCLKHKYRLGLANTEFCICGELSDAQHIILECPQIDREELFNSLLDLKVPLPFNLPSLLALESIDVYNRLYQFIVSNKITL